MNTNDATQIVRWSCLILLVVQNTSTILLIRYVRTQPGDLFFSTTAILCQDIMKIIASIMIFLIENPSINGLKQINKQVFNKPMDLLKTGLPALIYTVQNNLIYIAITHLDAAVFQVTSQMKILTTAFFMKTVLKRDLNAYQITSLIMLFCGISLIQLQTINLNSTESTNDEKNAIIGLICVIAASILSGFAGVYFEKILKNSNVSIWIRNIQLSVLGAFFSFLAVYIYDYTNINTHGFFFGYNYVVWANISVQSLGGLLVALVMKYADNILKGFATSIAIIFSCILSVYFFGTQVNMLFCIGTFIVVLSVFFYSYTPPKTQTTLTILPLALQETEKSLLPATK